LAASHLTDLLRGRSAWDLQVADRSNRERTHCGDIAQGRFKSPRCSLRQSEPAEIEVHPLGTTIDGPHVLETRTPASAGGTEIQHRCIIADAYHDAAVARHVPRVSREFPLKQLDSSVFCQETRPLRGTVGWASEHLVRDRATGSAQSKGQ
jgi:hypothetical protein